jgi:acyl carrier protein
MLERKGVISGLEDFVKKNLFLEVESPETEIALDSMGIVELLLHIEQTYGVALPMHEIEVEDLATVARIGDLVLRTAGAGPEEQSTTELTDEHRSPAL